MRGSPALMAELRGHDRVHLCRNESCPEDGQHFTVRGGSCPQDICATKESSSCRLCRTTPVHHVPRKYMRSIASAATNCKIIARTMEGSPPFHPSHPLSTILHDPTPHSSTQVRKYASCIASTQVALHLFTPQRAACMHALGSTFVEVALHLSLDRSCRRIAKLHVCMHVHALLLRQRRVQRTPYAMLRPKSLSY